MSILKKTLAKAAPGTRLRLTQSNGNVIDGIVLENDGKESLSVSIQTTAILRYDGIVGIEIASGQGAVSLPAESYAGVTEAPPASEVPAEDRTADAAPHEAGADSGKPSSKLYPPDNQVEITKVQTTTMAMKAAYRQLLDDRKRAVDRLYNQYVSCAKSHDDGKLREILNESWDIMKRRDWDYDGNYNLFHAYLLLANRDYQDAAESFYYANDRKMAYCCAYRGAKENNAEDLYAIAGAYAVLALLDKEHTELYEEAAEVLKLSALQAKDISFAAVLLERGSNLAKQHLSRILWYLCGSCGQAVTDPDDIGASVGLIRLYFTHTGIAEELTDRFDELEGGGDDASDGAAAEEPEPEQQPKAAPLTSKTLDGFISAYDPVSAQGTLRGAGDKTYSFQEEDVRDSELLNRLKMYRGQKFAEIPAAFTITEQDGGSVAVTSVKGRIPYLRNTGTAEQEDIASRLNSLIVKKQYEEALALAQTAIADGSCDDGVFYSIRAYLEINNLDPENGEAMQSILKLIDEYGEQITMNFKNCDLLRQVYSKMEMHTESLDMLNRLIDMAQPGEFARRLEYARLKALHYRALGDYHSAVAQLNDWLDIVSRNQLGDRREERKRVIFTEMAQLYDKIGDAQNALRYAKLAEPSAVMTELMERLIVQLQPDDETAEGGAEPVEEEEVIDDVPLTALYDSYRETENLSFTPDMLALEEIIEQFPSDRPYALLTWLAALEKVVSGCPAGQQMFPGSLRYTAAQTVSAVERLFSGAFSNPMTYADDFAATLSEVQTCAAAGIPVAMTEALSSAALLRALFHHSDEVQLYQYEALCKQLEEHTAWIELFPQLPLLHEKLLQFRQYTGYGIDHFAKYRTNHATLLEASGEAQRCLDELLGRLESFEASGRVRKTREVLFGDAEGLLRVGLDIAIGNRTGRAAWLKQSIAALFMRNGKSFAPENLDAKKIDDYVDDAWDRATAMLISEGYTVNNPHQHLVGNRRRNVLSLLNRILSCLCDWIEAAEQSAELNNAYAKSLVDENLPILLQLLQTTMETSEQIMDDTGFAWGMEAMRCVCVELIGKLDGTCDRLSQKYYYIDFLRDANVLLDDDYLPDLHATFCDIDGFSLLQRIRSHAKADLPSFEVRIRELFEDDPSKNNLRSARLIRDYGADLGITALSDHETFGYYAKCLKTGLARLKTKYEDFRADLELYEQFGSLSDVAGEKSRIQQNITLWYQICRQSGDYGFYVSLLDAYREKISYAAQKHGELLMRQVEELERDDSYGFGVYPPEKIRGYIEDQNFTVAANMLNCVRRRDVDAIADYAEEPFSYLNSFISEVPTNHRVTSDMGVSLEQAILKYTNKKDLERALRALTNNVAKDVRGGVSLISAWTVPRPNTACEDVARLLSLLGMPECTVERESGTRLDAYLVRRPRRVGKVTYPHPIPAFGSFAETEQFRVLWLNGTHDCTRLMDVFREANTTVRHTLVFLEFSLNIEERRKLARKLKEEKSFAKTFAVVDRVLLFYLAKHYAANTVNRILMATAMPFAYYQPFVEKSKEIMPPELFTGRAEALVSIEQPDGANLVYGGRQLGKSALLKMAKHNIDGNAAGDRAVLVEIQHLDYAAAAKEVSYRLITEGILPQGSETDDWEVLTRRIEGRLMSDAPNRINYLLLMLDEADTFIESCREVGHRPIALLKNLMPGRFKIVMAGLHNISRFHRNIALHGNSLLVHLESVVVKPFERPEAIELLTKTLAYLGLRFKDESVISLILAKTNYFPGLIQLYCQKLLETMRNSDYAGYGQVSTPPYEITEEHFKKVLANRDFVEEIRNKLEMTLFVEEEGHSHYHIIALLLSYLHEHAPKENGHTPEDVYRLAEEHVIERITALNLDQVRELMHEMWDLNILTAKDECYAFATKGFREMLGDRDAVEQLIIEYFEEGQV